MTYVLALFGVELIGKNTEFSPESRQPFRNFGIAMLTVLQITTFDSWGSLMTPLIETEGQSWVVVYFLLVIVIMGFTTMNLVTAALDLAVRKIAK